MLRIAVCDDNPDFLQQAVLMIERWSEQSRIPVEIYRFDNGDALLAKIDTVVKIIFLTSSPEFALDSYSIKAQGYLLKPVTYEKIQDTLDECSHTFDAEPKNIVIRTVFGYQKLYFHDIEYAEAQNKRVIFHLRSDKAVEAMDPLYTFEYRFTNDNGFFKCHRSYLVYLPNVDHFNMTEIITKSGHRVPIARGYGKAFQEAYFALMFHD